MFKQTSGVVLLLVHSDGLQSEIQVAFHSCAPWSINMFHNVLYSQDRNNLYSAVQQNKHVSSVSSLIFFFLYYYEHKMFMLPEKKDLVSIYKLGENMVCLFLYRSTVTRWVSLLAITHISLKYMLLTWVEKNSEKDLLTSLT